VWTLNMLPMRKPRSALRRFPIVCSSSPAATTKTTETPTCAAASPERIRARPLLSVVRRPTAFNAPRASALPAAKAGPTPNKAAVQNVAAAAIANSRQSSDPSTTNDWLPDCATATSAGRAAKASAMPAAPPRPPSSKVSVNPCRIRRPREAPSAARTTVSSARWVALANISPATFAQASSNTSSATPIKTRKGSAYCLRTTSSPERPGSTLRVCRASRSASALPWSLSELSSRE